MLIRCWGSRGSIPVSSPDHVQFGGDTSCLEVREEDTIIIVDAGTGARRLGQLLHREKIHSIHWFFSHTHYDHLIGFPFFQPLFNPRAQITIYEYPQFQNYVLEDIDKAIRPPYFPIQIRDCKSKICSFKVVNHPININSLLIDTIPISHTGPGLGFKFQVNGKTCVFLTDNELGYNHGYGASYSDYVEFCYGADLLIHDAEYTPEEYMFFKGYGHSSISQALQLAIDAHAKKFGFFHHNCNRTDSDIHDLEQYCHEIIYEKKIKIECFAVSQYTRIEL